MSLWLDHLLILINHCTYLQTSSTSTNQLIVTSPDTTVVDDKGFHLLKGWVRKPPGFYFWV